MYFMCFPSSSDFAHYSGKVTERLPPEILVLVCQAVEEPPPDGRALVLHKHRKITNILQIKNTCKSWYLWIATAKLLFRDIAFDTTNVSTVETAQACLRLLGRGSKIPLHVFIAGSEGDMDRFTRLCDKVTRLFKRLSGFGPSIVRCQVWDPSDKMCNMLKGRASALGYLRIGVTGRTSVFCGPLPSLRAMALTTSHSKLWNASTSPALSNLSLSYAGDPTRTSLRALIQLLQGLPQLQNLHLENFRHWVFRNPFLPKSGMVSTTLRKISFTDCDFAPVLQHLCAPNLRAFLIYGTRPNDNTTSLPLFHDPALLWRIQTPPLLETPGLGSIAAVARQEPTRRFFTIEISGKGFQFLVRLNWFRWRQVDWERWVDRSCRDLFQRLQLSPRVSLAIDFDRPSIATLFPAFSSLVCVKSLAVIGGSLCEILQFLGVSRYPSYQLRLPALKHLDLMAYAPLTAQEGNQVRSYLQFRAYSNAPVRVTLRSSAWREAEGCPWTSFMDAESTWSITTFVLRQ
ncbi:hypothetical protein BJ322DRAFT_1023605 [Thelephora terrestris]|uniref:F-box domain-containing protein n=1 Tax=Thelephora terrestris TaxID=56493 RepID=A0A9P6L3F3_9AGAM|nr:hypothetical protein BJ322DRAFT_1023605 [Thelephora terrestris]